MTSHIICLLTSHAISKESRNYCIYSLSWQEMTPQQLAVFNCWDPDQPHNENCHLPSTCCCLIIIAARNNTMSSNLVDDTLWPFVDTRSRALPGTVQTSLKGHFRSHISLVPKQWTALGVFVVNGFIALFACASAGSLCRSLIVLTSRVWGLGTKWGRHCSV